VKASGSNLRGLKAITCAFELASLNSPSTNLVEFDDDLVLKSEISY
jgi:hypothetical protein